MAFSTRELYLVLRARDEASRVLNNFAKNVVTTGRAAQLAMTKEAISAERARIAFMQKEIATKRLGLATQAQRIRSSQLAEAETTLKIAIERTELAQMSLAGATGAQTKAMRAYILELTEQRNAQRANTLELQREQVAMRENIAALEQQRVAARQNVLAMQDHARTLEEGEKRSKVLSQRLHTVGMSMISAGVASGIFGGFVIAALYKTTKAAEEYQRQTALTATQVDGFHASLKQLGDIGKRTANDIAVPFQETQGALYDIFSSTTANLQQAEVLLRAFSKGAVAGQTSLQTAGRATIAVLNAFHIPFSDVNKVMDMQFQLVRKGVGTYEQFATTIGRAIPSAVRAGQTFQTLGGMLIFLTRNGLSTAMAAASAGRALDAFSNPKTVERLEAMGVRVKDAAGNFRPLADVILDLQRKLANLTAPQRAKALQELFKSSGGTIQARRFFDIVLSSSTAAKSFAGFVDDMKHSTGAYEAAYKKMANTTASQTQLLKNRWEILKVTMGEALLPLFNKMLASLSKLLQGWNNLDPGVQKVVARLLLGVGVLAALAGIVLSVAGALAILASGMAALGGALGTAAAWAAGLVGALAALGAIFVVAWKSSQGFRMLVMESFRLVGDFYENQLKPKLLDLRDLFVKHLVPAIQSIVRGAVQGLVAAFRMVSSAIQSHRSELEQLRVGLTNIWNAFIGFARFMADHVFPILGPILKGIFIGIGAAIVGVINYVSFLVRAWNDLWKWVGIAIHGIGTGIGAAIGFIIRLWNDLYHWGSVAIKAIADAGVWLWHQLVGAFNAIVGAGRAVANFFVGLWHTIVDAFHATQTAAGVAGGFLSRVWHDIINAARAVGAAILDLAYKVFHPAWTAIQIGAQFVKAAIQVTFGSIQIAIKAMHFSIMWLWHNVFDPAWHGIKAGADWLYQNGILPLWHGINDAWHAIVSALHWLVHELDVGWHALVGVYHWVIHEFALGWKAIKSGADWLYQNGILPLWHGINTAWHAIVAAYHWLLREANTVWNALKSGGDWLYRNLILPIWLAFNATWHNIASLFHWLWKQANDIWHGMVDAAHWLGKQISKIWYDLSSFINAVWHKGIKAAFNEVVHFVTKTIPDAFNSGVNAIKKIWDKVVSFVKIPVKIVVNDVLNNGILKGYNALAHAFGVKPDDVRINLPKGFRTGGPINQGTTGTADDVLIRASRGEYVVNARSTQRHRELIEAINADRFASGGIVDLTKQITYFARGSGVPFVVTSGARPGSHSRSGALDYHALGEAVDMESSAANMVRLAKWLYAQAPLLLELIHSGGGGFFVKNGRRVGASFYRSEIPYHFNHVHLAMNQSGLHGGLATGSLGDFVLGPLRKIISSGIGLATKAVGNFPFAHVLINMVSKLASGILGHTAAQDGPTLGMTIGEAVSTAALQGQLGSWIMKAIQAAHVPLSWAGPLHTLVMRESSGNPTSVNRWDINWRAGHPSVGLAQVIRGTFEQYAGPFRNVGPFLYGVSTNPVANLYAAIKYILARYGSIFNVQQANPNMFPHGYRAGGEVLARLRPGETVWPEKYHDGGVVGQQGQRIPLPVAVGGGVGGDRNIVVNVTTNEINPTLHAQQLGWELLRYG